MATSKKPTAPETEQTTEAPAEQQPETTPIKRQNVNGVYYIVNPSGAIHGVDRAHAADRFKTAGWRLATEEEIATYLTQPIQRHDRPICAPWTADPDKQLAALEA